MNLRIGPLWIHRLEQWDFDCWPLNAHSKRPNRSTRIVCVWRWGIQVRPFRLSRAGLWMGRRLLWRP